MGKKLIITEKPSVAQDYAKVFQVSGKHNGYIENNTFVITWCVGHLVEMVYPEEYDIRYKKWVLQDLPFLPEKYKYGVIKSVKQQYDIVHALLQREDIDTVYWAGDSGKEGQTIEENIRNFGGVRKGMQELRVWIDSQTEEEIKRGVAQAKPMSAYANLGKSGIMRSIEDYAMGINFSRVMSVKYGKLLNDAAATKGYTAIAVGRVMTCVLGMVVNREREIRNFKETSFYRVVGDFTDANIEAEWKAVEGSAYFESPKLYKENGFKEKEEAETLISSFEGKEALVKTLEKGISKKKAPLLFNLAELQAECSKRFKISPDQTLQVAQDLYEKKLTTYPRTDARVLTTAVAKEIDKNLNGLKGYTPTQNFADHILTKKMYANIAKTQYTDDSKVTDHYAIIPTGQLTELGTLTPLQSKVFELIVRRFLSIFYPPAEYRTLKLVIGIEKESLFASAKVLKTLGFLEVMGKTLDDADEDEGGADDQNRTSTSAQTKANENPNDSYNNSYKEKKQNSKKLLALADTLKQGDAVAVNGFEVRDSKTSPPKRYTSGSMILAMENAGQLIEDEELRAQIKGSGIGTSATRAEIIKKLIRIGYLNLNQKTQVITPQNFGEMVYEVVAMTVPALLNPKMTASWEKGLDGITNGTVDVNDYRAKLEDFIRRETIQIRDKDLTNQLAAQISQFTGKGAKGPGARRKIGVQCPVCGGDIITTPFGYGCANYQKDGSGCNFVVGSIAGRSLSDEECISLIKEGKTEVLSGFESKKKKKFDAVLVLHKNEDGKVEIQFDFSQVQPQVLEDVVCPDCGGALMIKGFGYGCASYNPQEPSSCRFAIGKIADKELSPAQVKELLTNGITQTIRGFKSKNGKKFDACLMLEKDAEGKHAVTFNFEKAEAKKIKDVVCPLCGGEIVQTPFGYGCANYDKLDESSCKFSIGKMAGKDIPEAQIKELLTNGKTATIRGFKSKAGKKFDARVTFSRDAEGKITGLKFDFDDIEQQKLKDVKCPLCGGEIVKTMFGYGCSNYNKEDAEHSCRFAINNKIAGLKIGDSIVKQLLTQKKTDVIQGFLAKSGAKFDAPLKLTADGQVVFDFPDRPAPTETKLACPRCSAHKLKKSQWYYECACGFKIGHTVAQVPISEELMQELFTTGKTAEKVSGFVSKAGNPFDAYLKYADEKIQFEFNNHGESSAEKPSQTQQPWLDSESDADDYWESLMAAAAKEPASEDSPETALINQHL
ncbi:MAG: topoisomerase C-terminal repeat-containing protein [Lachnospiraceae bacterium]|nr:topoisomerase C-terminal repeat-containing protein [Lachnospiraceae bacterium]